VYLDLGLRMRNIRLNSIPLRVDTKVKRHGLYAKERISKDTIIREYTGKLVPTDDLLSDDFTQYQFEMDFGYAVALDEDR
jgi:hypothetical protein